MVAKNQLEPIFSNQLYQTSSLSNNFTLELPMIIFKYKTVPFFSSELHLENIFWRSLELSHKHHQKGKFTKRRKKIIVCLLAVLLLCMYFQFKDKYFWKTRFLILEPESYFIVRYLSTVHCTTGCVLIKLLKSHYYF